LEAGQSGAVLLIIQQDRYQAKNELAYCRTRKSTAGRCFVMGAWYLSYGHRPFYFIQI